MLFDILTSFQDEQYIYRPRSKGDNTFGHVRPSVRPSVRLSVCPFVCLSVYALTSEPFDL